MHMLIDVRTKEEYDAQHIEGAINLPVQDIQSQSEKVKEFMQNTSKDTLLQVHCASGGRSMIACMLLQQLGFMNVVNIGGFQEACGCVQK